MTCLKHKVRVQVLGTWTPSFVCELSFLKNFFKEKGINRSLCIYGKVEYVQKMIGK